MYLLLFGIAFEGILSVPALFLPIFADVRDSAVLPVVAAAAATIYARAHCKKTVKTRYSIASPLISRNIRIAMLSDVHMGLSVNEKRLRSAIDALSVDEPDILIVAGDLCDDKTTPIQMKTACRIIGSAKTKHGVYFIYGNHDVAAVGPKLMFSSKKYRDELTRNGVIILDDRTVEPGIGITLAGRLDAWGTKAAPRKSVEELLRGADPSLPVILVDHQPGDIRVAEKNGVLLQLSGHTHAGQVWPAGVLYSMKKKGIVYGHYQSGNSHVIVSSGLGTRGSRMRSGCTAEVVTIDLVPENVSNAGNETERNIHASMENTSGAVSETDPIYPHASRENTSDAESETEPSHTRALP